MNRRPTDDTVHGNEAPRLRIVDSEGPPTTPKGTPPARAERAGASAPTSFEEAFERHYPLVRYMVAQYGVEYAALDDVSQEVFLVVHRRWDSFNGRTAFTNWLVGITRRVARDHRRARRRAERRRDAAEHWCDDPTTPHEQATRKQAMERVQRFLDGLPLAQREVFVLAHVVGLSGPEIAEALGVRLNTAYSRLRLARDKFEQFVRETRDA